ncbi:unnamed protein product, partial [Notodromas monacha]
AHRIEDYYTRDRSTPREDAYWGFRSDITASFGVEEDGVTTIAFRRKLDASEPTDHSIVDDEMTVIWARGQEPGMYVHSPASGLEQGAASDPDFYRPDEIKYHGKKDQRGGQSDAVLGWIDRSGRAFIADMWIKGYTAPELDSNQDISDTSVVLEDGVVTVKFTRPRVSKDSQDQSLDECLHFLYPIKGGDVKAVSKKIGKHDARPEVSDQKICIRSCRSGADVPGDSSDETGSKVRVTTARTTTTTTAKPQMMMDVELKFIDVGDDFKIPRKNSPEFNELSERVKRSVTSALTSVPGFEDVSVSDFEESEEKELIAKLVVTLDHDTVSKEYKGRKTGGESEKAKAMVKQALQDSVEKGHVGELRVDPQYLIVGNPVVQNETAATRVASISDSQLKLYIVIGCIAFLVLVAVMQASCSIYRLNRRSTASKGHK